MANGFTNPYLPWASTRYAATPAVPGREEAELGVGCGGPAVPGCRGQAWSAAAATTPAARTAAAAATIVRVRRGRRPPPAWPAGAPRWPAPSFPAAIVLGAPVPLHAVCVRPAGCDAGGNPVP